MLKKWPLLAFILCFFVPFVSAKEHTFIFKIHSSSSKIYACHAGVKHVKPTQEVCYLVGTTTPCTRGTHDCECYGTNGGAYLMDYMKYTKQYMLPNDSVLPLETGIIKVNSAGDDVWNTIPQGMNSESHSPNPFFTHLKELTFNFGSERYGSEMFVDICYRAPQIEHFEDDAANNYALKSTVLATDLNPNNDPGFTGYQELSGLNVSAVAACDMQGLGNYPFARDNVNFAGRYDTFNHEIDIASPNNNDWKALFPFTSTVTGNVISIFDQQLVNNNPRTPRFCVVRYYFKETTVNNLRKWQRHDAQVKVWTAIEAEE